jgi:hypothetical protein
MSNANAVQQITLALENIKPNQALAVRNAGQAAAQAALVATAAAAAANPENAAAAAANVAASVTMNANKMLANAQAAAPAAVSKNIKAAIRCITKKSDKGFYQRTPASKRAYPCPPQDLPDGTKKGSITEAILDFFDGSSKNATPLTKSLVATQPAVASRVIRVLQSKGYAGGKRTRKNRF